MKRDSPQNVNTLSNQQRALIHQEAASSLSLRLAKELVKDSYRISVFHRRE